MTINAFIGKGIKNLLVQLYGKLTYSPRANSQSLGVTFKYNIKKHIYLMLMFNGYQITMHKGYKVGFLQAVTTLISIKPFKTEAIL